MQVWSADWGYPGDYDYREFHKKDGLSGLRYWRITSAKSDLAYKDYYHPDWAEWKVGEHARHFAWLVREILSSYHRETGQRGIVAAIYDTELFGHWWFEGIGWIKKVIQELATSQGVGLTTATGYVEARPPTEVLALPEGSWGVGGGHFTWDNGDTHWMWGEIHEAERRMEGLAARYEEADQGAHKVLNQAARELLLLQSSDWPFLVTTGQAREYAVHRFQSHLERFSRLADSLEMGHPDQGLAEEYWEQDKVFPHIDYHWFLPR
jgi:1,4-alpha-glucan branching enzyme